MSQKFLHGLLLPLACLALLGQAPANAQRDFHRDNIILVLADDLGFGDLNPKRMPRLSALKDQLGTEFDRFLVHQEGTPSRAAFLTGMDPTRLNMFSNFHPAIARGIDPEEELISERLKARGYATCMVGKWGVGRENVESPMVNGFASELRFGRINNVAFETKRLPDIYFTDGAIEFIRSGTEPFFLYAAFQSPRAEYQAPRKYFEANREEFGITKTEEQKFLVESNGIVSKRDIELPDDVQSRVDRCLYYSMVGVLDDQIIRLYEMLRQQGRADRTLFLFASDNGGVSSVADNGVLREGKSSVYDGAHRSCNALIWPGVVPVKKRIKSTVWIADMFPTFAEIAGDAESGKGLDGGSAIGAILHNKELLRGVNDDSHAVVAHAGKFRRPESRTVISGEFCVWYLDIKYVRMTEFTLAGEVKTFHEELYLIATDPGEKNELLASGGDDSLLKRMRDEYEKWGGDERLMSLETDDEVREFIGFESPERWEYRKEALRSDIWP